MNNTTKQEIASNYFDSLILLLESNTHFSNFLYSVIVINSLNSILAAVLNFLIILTFVKTPSLRTPSYILILSLAFSDLGVGVVTEPAYCIHLIAWLTKNPSLYESSSLVVRRTFSVLITGSLLTITSITIDRFLALHLRLRYQQLVTTKRSYIVVITIWVVSLSWSGVLATKKNWLSIIDPSFSCVVIIFNLYLMLKISRGIRRHLAQIHAQQQPQQLTMTMQRYKKSVKTMNYIMGVFLVCYLPSVLIYLVYFGMKEAQIRVGIELLYAGYLADTLVMINSALNPLIYCWRIEEIRNALLQLLRRQ